MTAGTRKRNFSNWAYWRLLLDAQTAPAAPPADVDAWRAATRARLVAMLGAEPAVVPLDLETTESVDCGTYQRERVVFDTEKTMSVPAYLLVPHARRDAPPGPAVLAIHGHGAGKALVCGLEPGGPGDDYAHQLAELGYVVLAPDLRGFGERADWMPSDKYECDWNLVCAVMAGVVPLERNLWDLQRALDVLTGHELVDATRVGAAGLSYGGTCTLFLTALDDRVRAAVISGYLSSWRAAHEVPWNMCGSQVMPGQLGAIEHLDIAALIAPRPVLIESGTDDDIFPIASARATVDALRRVYAAVGAPSDAVAHDVFGEGHRWHGALVPEILGASAMSGFDARLEELGIILPGPYPPHDPLDAVVVHGGRARTSGQLPRDHDGKLVHPGVVGADVTADQGTEAARWCALNALSVLRAELGSLDRIDRVLTVLGFVASTPGFGGQPAVVDGASRLLADVFGPAGRHSRSAIGVAALPRGGAVEIEVEVSIR